MPIGDVRRSVVRSPGNSAVDPELDFDPDAVVHFDPDPELDFDPDLGFDLEMVIAGAKRIPTCR